MLTCAKKGICTQGKRSVVFKLALVLFLSMSLGACKDETPRATIPFAPVSFQIDLNGLDHPLKNALSYKTFTEQDRRSGEDRFGYSGVLVVSDATGTSLYAYDLCCPHEKRRETKIVPNDDGTAECPVCGSMFVTLYGRGTVEKGPGTEPLQRYRVIPLAVHPGMFQVVN